MTEVSVSDNELMSLVRKRRDGEAFQALFQRYSAPIWHYVRAKVCIENAEDVFQEVAVKFFTFLTRKEAEEPAALAFTFAKHAIAQHYRSLRGKAEKNQSLETLLDQGMEFYALNERTGAPALAELSATMTKLGFSPDQKTTFLLHYYVGFTTGEIAKTTGTPEDTVKSRLRLAKLKLGRHLRREDRV